MALYLGKDKIASSGTIAGDTLPIGTVVEYDGTEVPANWELFEDEENGAGIPEINQSVIYLTNLADGLYKCTYETMWASPAEEEAQTDWIGLILGEQQCYLYKVTPPPIMGAIIVGAYCQPFTVRLINATGDTIIHVDSSGMGTKEYMSPHQLQTIDNKIGVEKVDELPDLKEEALNSIYKYNGELYSYEYERIARKSNLAVGMNLNKATLSVEFLAYSATTCSLEASDGKGNTFSIYQGEPKDNKMGHYGLYVNCYFNGQQLYQDLYLGEYTDRGDNIEISSLEIPEADFIVSSINGLNSFLQVSNIKTNTIIARKISEKKMGNFKLCTSQGTQVGTFAFEIGMTWEEFVNNSNFNDLENDFFLSDNDVCYAPMMYHYISTSHLNIGVQKTDYICPGGIYFYNVSSQDYA